MFQPLAAIVCVGSVLAAGGTPARSQPPQPAQPPTQTAQEPTPPAPAVPDSAPIVSRADLARAFLRFENALAARPPTPARLTEISSAFDSLTAQFFTGDFASPIARLNQITRGLELGPDAPPPTLAEQLVEAIKIDLDPPVCAQGDTVKLRLGTIYRVELPEGEHVSVRVRLSHPDGRQTLERTLVLGSGAPAELLAQTTIDLENENALSGWWSVEIAAPGSQRWNSAGHLTVLTSGSLVQTRRSLLAALDAAAPQHPDLAGAIATARSRAGALTDRPSPLRSIEFLFDPIRLSEDVEREIRTILAGTNPYTRRTGDWWREVPAGDGKNSIPVRIYAPAAAAKDQPLPLVIALHGAGGDEHMFMDAYGHGVIKALADEKGFIVTSPGGTRAASPAGFDALVAAAKADYAIDDQRIYVVGHSMGAMGAAALASTRPNQIAAVACLAGGPMRAPADKPEANAAPPAHVPTLVIAAELDTIIPAARLKAVAAQAKDSGRPIQYREAPALGHTMIVGAKLSEAIEWLLAKRLTPRP